MKWETVKLESVAEVIAGQSPESQYYNQSGDGFPFFQGKADFGYETPTVRYWCTKPTKIAKENDILLSVRAPVGPTNICNLESCIGRGLAAIRVGQNLNHRFLYWWFKSYEHKLSLMGNGSTFSAITTKDVKGLTIPLPPLPIQQQIADTLDKADALRRKDQELITSYVKLIRSIYFEFINNITSEEKTLEEVAGESGGIRCGPFGTQLQVSSFKKTGVPLWGIKHVNRQFKVLTDEFISEEKALELSIYTIIPGDLVMTRKGTIGNVCVYPDDLPIGIMHSDLLRIRLNTDLVCSTYMQLHLQYDLTIKEEIKKISHGAIMAGINVSKLKKLKVKVPTLKNQKEFSEKIKKINKLINNTIQIRSYSFTLFQKISADLMS